MTDFANMIVDSAGSPTLLNVLKQQLGIDVGDTTREEELSLYLEMVGQAAESYIDNIIDQREVTEQLAMAKHPVALRYWPAIDLVAVTVDGEDKLADYSLYFDDGIGWGVKDACGSAYSTCFDQMAITYTAGFDPLPADIAYALTISAGWHESNYKGQGIVKKESVVGVGSIEYATADDISNEATRVGILLGSSVSVLDRYKRLHA